MIKLAIILVSLISLSTANARLLPTLPEWEGEYLQAKEGVFYMKIRKQPIQANNTKIHLTGSLQIIILNILTKKKYRITQKPYENTNSVMKIWKAPVGKYSIQVIKTIDSRGIKRITKQRVKHFIVKKLKLSNLGQWTVSPFKKKNILLSIKRNKNSYKEENRKKESSLVAIINGFNGLLQQKLAGKKLFKKLKTNYGTQKELRASYSYTRNIALFYTVNLFRNNHLSKKFMLTVSTKDLDLRKCYTDRLDWKPNIKGNIKYKFLLSKRTKSLAKIKKTGGSLNDNKVIKCVYYLLAQMNFSINKSLIGEINLEFDIRN